MNSAAALQKPPFNKAASNSEWFGLAWIMTTSAAAALGSGLLSAAANKIIAVLAGPAAIAVLATLQQVSQTALVAATLNGGTALVRGARARGARARGAQARFDYVRTVAMLFASATLITIAALCTNSERIARASGFPPARANLIAWTAPAVALSAVYVFLTALLGSLGAARRLAVLQLAGPAAMALLAAPLARRAGDPRVFPLMLAAAAGFTVVCAVWAIKPYWADLARWFSAPGRWWHQQAAAEFFSIAGAMLATGLLGSAALVVVRARILRVQGLSEAGLFDAAWTLSMNQVSLVLASLQSYYLPALAGTTNARERNAQITRVLTLGVAVAAGAIALLAIAKPFWLSVLYSSQFHAANRYLRWTLVGDYLKVCSWILSIPMLAAARMRIFLAADLAAYSTFVGSAAVLAPLKGAAEAAAIAFVLMHAVHLIFGAVYVRLRGFPALVAIAGFMLVAAVSAWSWNS